MSGSEQSPKNMLQPTAVKSQLTSYIKHHTTPGSFKNSRIT